MINSNVLFIVYHDLETEARSVELLTCLKDTFSTVHCICRKKPDGQLKDLCNDITDKGGTVDYYTFIKLAKEEIRKRKPNIVVLHDEFTSVLIPYIRKNLEHSFIIYDSSELNIKRKLSGIKNKICKGLYYIEKKQIIWADLIIAANEERARMMKEYYKTNASILVFDNMHRIDDEYDEYICSTKYGDYYKRFKYVLVYGGGISSKRLTFELADAVEQLGKEYCLIVAGSNVPKDLKRFKNLYLNKKEQNIFYVGFIERCEWKYLLEKSTASCVLFKADCPNTRYCASGKMYESLFLGVPIICSDNPPLRRICNTHNVGIASNDYKKSIIKVCENNNYYRENTLEFINNTDYDQRLNRLSHEIIEAITR